MSDKRLVLLSCCAPCSCGAIRQLAENKIPNVSEFVVLFYNPNIYPMDEYQKRLDEQIKYCESLGVACVALDYDHDAWLDYVRGLESAPERGDRCSKCFEYRFRYGLKWAQDNGFNAIASVLGISRYKNQDQVDSAALSAIGNASVEYLPIQWDMDLYTSTNREADFYRQKYCGCEFSIRK